MKLSFKNLFSYVNYITQKLLSILANKNSCIGAMYYGNVCQNAHIGTIAYKIVSNNSIGATVSTTGYNCTII